MTEPRVGHTAFALGFAGLLPQLALVVFFVAAGGSNREVVAPIAGWALIYPAIILSFLGGMWWTIAMRRRDGQGWLAAVAVLPSLVAAAVLGFYAEPGWNLVILGSAILLTLPVDRYLTGTGEAPMNWMTLRIPLSVGLGALTIAAGALLSAWAPA